MNTLRLHVTARFATCKAQNAPALGCLLHAGVSCLLMSVSFGISQRAASVPCYLECPCILVSLSVFLMSRFLSGITT
jgi:hypothetical protein